MKRPDDIVSSLLWFEPETPPGDPGPDFEVRMDIKVYDE